VVDGRRSNTVLGTDMTLRDCEYYSTVLYDRTRTRTRTRRRTRTVQSTRVNIARGCKLQSRAKAILPNVQYNRTVVALRRNSTVGHTCHHRHIDIDH
jgi:hypothetical protein